ncbi:phosphoglycerate mutase-like protein [Xylariaceae sp. FL1651]|nr:phosphoglycerate mutase-like protein [Xylariaceae sp. FL1651]
MSLEVIYVTRHGFRSSWTVDPTTGTYTAYLRSPTGLPTDPALTSHGVEQAGDLAEHLLQLDPPIEQVYSSPYYRCLQTVSPFISRHNSLHSRASSSSEAPTRDSPFRIRAESGLGEWYGRAHFEHPSSAPLSDLSALFADLDANYASSSAPRRHGESIPQLYERVASCIQAIITRSDQEGKKAVLVCTHAAVVIALGRILTGKVPEDASVEDFGAFTCGLSVYRRQGIDTNQADTAATITTASIRGQVHKSTGTPNVIQNADLPSKPGLEIKTPQQIDRRAIDPRGSGCEGGSRSCSSSVSSRWICEVDSDCSFLRGGAERGWRFSGDESFVEISQEGLLPSKLELGPRIAVDEDGGSSSTGIPKL